jgi:hypothetical protein
MDKLSLRKDHDTARTIDQCIGIQNCYGTYCAAMLLRGKGVDIELALRVLTQPASRRPVQQVELLAPRMYGSVSAISYRHTHT